MVEVFDYNMASSNLHTRGKGTFIGKLSPSESALDQTTSKVLQLATERASGGLRKANLIAPYSSGQSGNGKEETTSQSISEFWNDLICSGLNDTEAEYINMCMNNSANSSSTVSYVNSTFVYDNSTSVPEMGGEYWVLFLILIPLLTVFGNVLVVMSVYRERSLRTVTNYFICSLAVADIMVAVMVMPLAIYLEVSLQTCISK